jgi:hypothetical protein
MSKDTKGNAAPVIRVAKRFLFAGLASVAILAPMSAAQAAGTIKFGDEGSISVGLGMRGSFNSDEHGAADGSRSNKFDLDSVRLYVNANLTKSIAGTFNTERNADGEIVVLDAYARFEPKDEFNIWIGRMLPPSDRANLDGPYFISSWSYPGLVSRYPAKFAGRDDGVTVWGKVFEKKLTYAVGVFNGHNRIRGASNEGDNPLIAGRVAFNFWDVEDNPAYYTSSTYYGGANVLTLAVSAMSQKDGVGTALRKGDFFGWNVDALMEKKIAGGGAFTLEGAYYDYDTDGVADVSPSFGGAGYTANVGGLVQGKGYLGSVGFLFPTEVGPGKFQPVFRYQQYDVSLTDQKLKQYDFGVNYILKGHNARLSLEYSHQTDNTPAPNNDRVTFCVQLQF